MMPCKGQVRLQAGSFDGEGADDVAGPSTLLAAPAAAPAPTPKPVTITNPARDPAAKPTRHSKGLLRMVCSAALRKPCCCDVRKAHCCMPSFQCPHLLGD